MSEDEAAPPSVWVTVPEAEPMGIIAPDTAHLWGGGSSGMGQAIFSTPSNKYSCTYSRKMEHSHM